jgi:predicted nucleotidyltransferase
MSDDIDIIIEQNKKIRTLENEIKYKDRLIKRLEYKIELLKEMKE